jgi:hypothetical protein
MFSGSLSPFPGSDNNPALELPRVAGVPCSFVTVTLNPFCSCEGKDSVNAIRRLNAAINEEMGMPNCGRGEWSREQLAAISTTSTRSPTPSATR